MADTRWKAFERRVAAFFGSTRTPLSGGNGKQTRSDTLHDSLFIEAKQRANMSIVSLWDDTNAKALEEQRKTGRRRIPVLAIHQVDKKGFWIVCHSQHFIKVAIAAAEAQGGLNQEEVAALYEAMEVGEDGA